MKADLRNTDTKERIITEGLRLYQQGGYKHLNLDSIARLLDITRPALYFHFPGGKEQLLDEVLMSWAEMVIQDLEKIVRENQDARCRVRAIMLGITFQPFPGDKEIIKARFHDGSTTQKEFESFFLKINQIITGVIREGIEKGELRPVDPNIAFFSLMGFCDQVAHYQAFREQLPGSFTCMMPERNEELVEKLIDLWFDGVVAT
jgi:AcrR family transcriptional regulator